VYKTLAAAVPLLTFLVVEGTVPPRQPAPGSPGPSGPAVSVVTLNMAKAPRAEPAVRELAAVRQLHRSDIYLLQEVSQEDGRQAVAEELASAMGLHVVYAPAARGVSDQGLAILSRHPLRDSSVIPLRPFDLMFRSRTRIALAVTVESPLGPVRVYNAHLDTRLNLPDRVRQLEPVIRDSAAFNGPRIIGGDFNTNNFFWLGRVLPLPFPSSQTGGMVRHMARHGFITPISGANPTFDHLSMRLDWVFSSGLSSRNTAIYPMQFSDHHAVWVEWGMTVPRPRLSSGIMTLREGGADGPKIVHQDGAGRGGGARRGAAR
jgi:endonuclease/exonuclease/phosphatase family metal-dependent hydrolase